MIVFRNSSLGTVHPMLGAAVWAAALIVASLGCEDLKAQTTDQNSKRPLTVSSELAHENMSRVGASAADIKAVLTGDPGLMVELKRWIAKDATDHGQIVSDSDLSNEAVFERLESDAQFRSAATTLLQRYGYLMPRLNPSSELGREHDLVVQERAKWIAQNEEEELAQARQRARNPQPLETSCESQAPASCNPNQLRNSPAGNQWPGAGQGSSLPSARPGEANPSVTPNAGGNQLLRAQSLQDGGEFADVSSQYSQLPLRGASGLNSSLSGSDQNLGGDLAEQVGSLDANGRLTGPGSPETLDTRNANAALAAIGMSVETSNSQPPDMMRAAADMNPMASSTAPGMPFGSPSDGLYRELPRVTLQPAELVRKRSPYEDIPSLYDMYVQALTRPATPRRFGQEVFDNGTRDPQLIPMDLPAGPEYVVGPGDGLSIDLWGGVSQRLYRVVDREGRVALPDVGPVLVNGKSLAEIQQNVQQILRTQFRDVSADVSLSRLRTIRIYEVGDVTNPGAYDISSLSTPLNALFAAGGPTARGSMRIVNHYRGKQLVQVVDLYDLLLHGVKDDIQRLENGDTVQVPPVGPQVTVEGMVRRPAVYELRNEKSLAEILELAGGLLPTATLRHIEVQRVVAHDKQTMLSLDVPETDSNSVVTGKLEAFQVQDGDRMRIFPIAPYNQNAVYLEGHVLRPGKYSFRPGMRITDLISSNKDLLPEPSMKYAEIVRLNAPDFSPSVEGFNLGDALANPSQAPVLNALDTVRIFSRFDFQNPPTVSVLGEVRAPGLYQTSGQIRLSDAVYLAGGLAPDAETGDAQVFRSLEDGKSTIFSVNLSLALEGDPTANIVLQPRDRVLIHRSPNAVQPASVYIQGEVAKPGRYPLTSDMRVGDLIRVGGGIKPSADTAQADLTRFEISGQKINGDHQVIELSAALSGDERANTPLHNGDVLTIRQLAGWNDLGAAIRVSGEVVHPGTYGIRPGERLSSVLERAGGFQPAAYPYGAILQRLQVREFEAKSQDTMILRVKDLQNNLELLPEADARQKQAKETALAQYQATLTALTNNPPTGRVTVRISSNIAHWKNTSADVEVRAGDTLIIPKRPSYVTVNGQVYNATAVSYRSGKGAKWYLAQAGGPTRLADQKAIFVVRADGTVIGEKKSLFIGDSLSSALQPGDSVIVPEKAVGGGIAWQTVFLSAQVASSIATSIFIAAHY